MEKPNLVALILAGGRGERFWPRSTSSTPKHLLKFGGGKVMLAETVERFKSLIPLARIFIVTQVEDARVIKKILPEISASNIIVEPYRRNTASAIGLSAVYIRDRFPGAAMAIFPSDHVIRDKKRFLAAIRLGALWARKEKALVTLGIKPTRPETGYGYIERGKKIAERNGLAVHRVKRFVEKPDLERAKKFMASAGYLWNAGMFIFTVEEVFRSFESFMPGLYRGLIKIKGHLNKKSEKEVVRRVYKNLKSTSIDYGIMERAGNRLVVTADFFWNDVGSWISLEELYPRDRGGNISLGETLSLDTSGSLLVSDKGLLAAIGLKDMAVISTPLATLVFPKDRAQEVRRVVEALRHKKSLKKYL